MKSLVSAAIVCVLLISAAPAPAQDLVKATLLADTSVVQPGQPFRVGVMFKIAPKWHIYWANPGDAGIATTVELKLPEGFVASSIQYPLPRRAKVQGNIWMNGYENEVMLLATITPPKQMPARISIGANVEWLACEEQCIPGEAKLNLSLAAGGAPNPNQRELFDKWQKQVPVPVAQSQEIASYINSVRIEPGPVITSGELTVTINWKDAVPQGLEWFAPPSDAVLFREATMQGGGKTSTYRVRFDQVPKRTPPAQLESVISFATPNGRVGFVLPVSVTQNKP